MRPRFFVLSLASLLLSVSWAGSVQAQTTTLYSSTIGVSSPAVPNPRGAGYNNTNITLNLTSGTTYTIKVACATLPAYALDPYIYLINPSGVVVGADDDNSLGLGNPYGSYLVYTAAVTGPHVLVVTTYSAGASYPALPVDVTYPTPTTPPPPPPPPTPTSGIPNVKLQLPKKSEGAQLALDRQLDSSDSIPGISATPELRGSAASATAKSRTPRGEDLLMSRHS